MRPRFTQLRIGNFKAFGETQTIPIKPITLIFGANSSGKSSILHSLAYVHELSVVQGEGTGRRSDVHRTQLGGKSIDLGGFAQLVHRTSHGGAGPVHWACKIDISPEHDDDGIPDGDTLDLSLGKTLSLAIEIGYAKRPPSAIDLIDPWSLPLDPLSAERLRALRVDDEPERSAEDFNQAKQYEAYYRTRLAELESDAASMYQDRPFLDPGVTRIDVQIDDIRLCLLEHESTDSDGTTFKVVEWNFQHSALTRLIDMDAAMDPRRLWAAIQQAQPATAGVRGCSAIGLTRSAWGGLRRRSRQTDDAGDTVDYKLIADRFWAVAQDVLQHVDEHVWRTISGLLYLAPLRSLPPRLFSPGEQQDLDWRPSGRDAWDRLIESEELREQINDWLGESKLAATFRVDVEHLVSLEQLEDRFISKFAPTIPDTLSLEEREHLLFRELVGVRRARQEERKQKCAGQLFSDADKWEQIRFDSEMNSFVFAEGKQKAQDLIRQIRHSPIPKLPQLLLRGTNWGPSVTHRDVGVGISQVLPVLVAALGSSEKTLLMEQPELHLHPRLQAELGDVFIDSALNHNNTLILETHSEHLILRLLRRIRETTHGTLPDGATALRPEDITIIYVKQDGDQSIVMQLRVDEDGDFMDRWPGGFFEDGFNEREAGR